MKNSKPEIVGFNFTEIPLAEAQSLVLAGDGNYSDVKSHLLQVLPTLENSGYAFGLPGGKEVPEDQRRGLTMALNATLTKAGVGWKVTYSSNRKLFICVPKSRSLKNKSEANATPAGRGHYVKNGVDPMASQIVELYRGGMTFTRIMAELHIGEKRVMAALAAQGINPRARTYAKMPTLTSSKAADDLLAVARATFKFTDPKLMPRQVRKAICVVGVYDLKISPKDLAPRVGISPGGVEFNATAKNNNFGKEQTVLLRSAIKEGN